MRIAAEVSAPLIARRTDALGWRSVFAILALAFFARLLTLTIAVVQFPHDWIYTRGIELGTLAHSLVMGQGLSSPFGGSTGPTALLAPGYPALIATVFLLFHSFSFAAAIAIMAMQLLFSVLTVVLILRIANRYFGSRTAILAASFWALSLPVIWMPTIFWDTCLSTLLLISSIALALKCKERTVPLLWMLMGTYFGLAALVNPALLPTLLAILAWTAWETRHRSRYSPAWALVLLCLTYAPWPIRNMHVFHAFIPLRSTIGFELWVGNRPGATGFLDESQFPIFNKREFQDYVVKGELVYMRDKSAVAVAYIRTHRSEFLRLTGKRFIRFWTGTGSDHGSIAFAVHGTLLAVLGWAGLWRLLKRHQMTLAVLLSLPLLLFPLPYYITHAEFRYRLVIDPVLTILAGYAISEWRDQFYARRGRLQASPLT